MAALRAIYEAKVAKGLDRDPGQESVVDRLDVLHQALAERRRGLARLLPRRAPPRGLYLWGDVGRGKSMLVDATMEAFTDVRRRRAHFHAFMRDTHRALHDARAAAETDPVAAAADRMSGDLELLALDEVEISDIVDAMIVGRVFERVLSRGIVLVATSNRAPSALYRDGLKRDLFLPFVRLLEDRLDVMHLEGGRDYRRGRALDAGIYLTPDGGSIVQRMDDLWRALLEGTSERPSLDGRTRIRRAGRAVRASFDALCRRPLAAADYLDLVRTTEVLLLDDVPRLGERDHDAARRFILLVDTLYDARRGLVVGAAAEPEEIYVSGEFVDEFRRTVSRLHEMTRPDWPGRQALR